MKEISMIIHGCKYFKTQKPVVFMLFYVQLYILMPETRYVNTKLRSPILKGRAGISMINDSN